MERVSKPKDWPSNKRESILDLISSFCDDFQKNPSYKSKEQLIALTTFDPSLHKYSLGSFRFSDYESATINELYMVFRSLNFQHGVSFLYQLMWYNSGLLKKRSMLPDFDQSELQQCYRGLHPCLLLVFWTGFIISPKRVDLWQMN